MKSGSLRGIVSALTATLTSTELTSRPMSSYGSPRCLGEDLVFNSSRVKRLKLKKSINKVRPESVFNFTADNTFFEAQSWPMNRGGIENADNSHQALAFYYIY